MNDTIFFVDWMVEDRLYREHGFDFPDHSTANQEVQLINYVSGDYILDVIDVNGTAHIAYYCPHM